ncbi:efflux RND transporter periplasmic adaptor subunit [Chitinilyticum piscinae]|uniref:Efflux RND transporter periplasmic adaptor subunit n=1 Tax=Chitinilyticum piscinae TaxID=2866724 RepID=A0A8J7FHX3_9NEIS|nr:efflux RND transporter periplasmic adaptor subunit [Chitinilyticum piscinae]MBE9609768.1 efflux RND transporter periplasmic adaptor subunit [Chitinilyticum piscinae]
MPETDLSALRIERAGAAASSKARPRWLRPLLGLALLALASAAYLAHRHTSAVRVQTATVTLAWPAQGLTLLNATGYVVADTKAAVASKATGRLEWLGVREGSSVKAGEVIARLENSDMQAQLSQARANVLAARARFEQARAERIDAEFQLKRQQDLASRNFVAQAAVDAARNRAQQAAAGEKAQAALIQMNEAVVRNAEVALDNTIIRAPFSGVVLTKEADVGDVVAPFNASSNSKGAVVTMADLATLEVEADVSETSLAKARVGQPVEIRLDALPDLRLAGTVARLVPTVDRSKATVKFKIRFDDGDPRILPDMSAKIAFLERALRSDERQPRLAIAASAVRDGKVFVIQDGHASGRTVASGQKLGDLLEIRSGLKAGDVVIANPPAGLTDGSRVEASAP